jgi:hypothetical protein
MLLPTGTSSKLLVSHELTVRPCEETNETEAEDSERVQCDSFKMCESVFAR